MEHKIIFLTGKKIEKASQGCRDWMKTKKNVKIRDFDLVAKKRRNNGGKNGE